MNSSEYSKIIQEARQKLQELIKEIELKKQEKNQLTDSINNLNNQITTAQKSLALLTNNIQNKESKLNDLDNVFIRLTPTQQNSIVNENLTHLIQQLEHKKIEFNEIEKKNEQAEQERKRIQEEIFSKETLRHQLQSQLANFNAKKIEIQQRLNLLIKNQEELKQEVLSLAAQKESLESRVTEISSKNPDLSFRERLQAEIEQFLREKQSLERQVADLHTQIEELNTKRHDLALLEPQLAEKEIKLATLKEKIIQKQEAIESLSLQFQKLEQQNDTLKLQYQDYSQKFTETKSEVLSSNNQKELLQNNCKYLENKEKELKEEVANLINQSQELQQSLAIIREQNPNIATLENLHKQTEQIRLEKSDLEGQKEALQSQLERLEAKRDLLQPIEAQLNSKKIELEQVISQLEHLRSQTQPLEQKAFELELLRVTYDALFAERQNFEERVKQLRPEIERLELQKQQILQAIETSEQEYLKVEQRKEESRILALEIKERQAKLNRSEREARRLEGIIAGRQEENAYLEQRLKEIKGEISELENSASIALQSLSSKLWNNLPTTTRTIDPTPDGEQQFIKAFSQFLLSKGLSFPDRVIRAFHTSLKVQDISALAILAGISGTGKSELPQRYADFTGAQMLTLAVQPRWDSPQDLQGFYNYIEKKYKPTDLMRGLYQYQNDPQMRDRLVIVLLDEMNLARVEYYFSDFLSKLETRRSKATYLDLDVGSLPLPENQRRLLIPHQFLFVGTMNEDETTQSLSDKVLDRANVLTFGKPQALKLREEYRQNGSSSQSPDGYISYSQFQYWMRKPDPNSEVVKTVRKHLDNANDIMEKLGHPFAHRVYQAITAYVVNYPGVMDGKEEAFQAALADQFGQKLLPKLRGLMIDECHTELEELSKVIKAISDRSLEQAFEQAKQGRYGQFQWRGFVYQNEQELISA